MPQLGFYYDMTACIACKTCQIACKDKNNLEVGVLFRRLYTFEGGRFPNPWIYHISVSCNHCEDPRCVANCPTGVDACPMRAIEFGDIAELRRKHGGTDRVKGLPDPSLTRPSLTVTPNAEALA